MTNLVKGPSSAKKLVKVTTNVDLRVFDMQAIKSACYKLSDIGQPLIKLDPENENQAIVVFSLSENYSEVDVERFLADFNVELVDYDLRIKIRAETEVTRNLILAYAFADSKLIEE